MSVITEIGSSASDTMSPFIQGGFGLAQQHQAHKYNKQMQERQWFMNNISALIDRQWQEKMSNTAYQRSVNDMRKAGLNPILMFGSASAASTPHGSTAGGVGSPSAISAGSISPLSFPDLTAMASKRDLRRYARENHEVNVATKEADLAMRELQAVDLYTDIQMKRTSTALQALDYDRRSRSWYQTLQDYRDIRNIVKPDSKVAAYLHDFVNSAFGITSLIQAGLHKVPHSKRDIHNDGYRMAFPDTGYKYRYFRGFRKYK